MRIPDEIRDRRSIRAFTKHEISDKEAELLVEAARLAPSAGNLQPWEFIIVRDPKIKGMLVDAAHGQAFIYQAPVVFVVCVVPMRSVWGYESRGRELYCLQDTAAAVQNLILTAKANGLGSCWVGAFNEKRAAEALGLSDDVSPVAIVPVGFPAESPRQRPRRLVKQVTHKDKW
jgi:nitroreductase